MDENTPPNENNEKDLRTRKDFNKAKGYMPNECRKIPSGNQQFIANRYKLKKVKSESFTKKLNKKLLDKSNLIT